MNWRLWLLLGVVAAMALIVFLFPAIPQSEAYHHFADTRTFAGIPNALDVLSNAFFLIVGLLGVRYVLRGPKDSRVSGFLDPRERWPYFIFFLGVALTTFGSAYYHAHPDDARLVWDRLPMTLGFMSLLAATLNERVSVNTGSFALAPLLIFGVASVLYWSVTQAQRPRRSAAVRPRAIRLLGSPVAAGRVVSSALHARLGPDRLPRDLCACESIRSRRPPHFQLGGIVSGHALKHIAAAVSAYWILRMLQLRSPESLTRSRAASVRP